MKGRKTGGRLKGTPNRSTASFRESLRAYCTQKGVDPHHFMADLLADATTDPGLQLKAAQALAEYLEPRLKAMEVTGHVELNHTLTITDRTREANDRLARVRRGDLTLLPQGGAAAD